MVKSSSGDLLLVQHLATSLLPSRFRFLRTFGKYLTLVKFLELVHLAVITQKQKQGLMVAGSYPQPPGRAELYPILL